ncbi:MAG: DegQ family serine endoprotease [Deltaproteobacteria bacterium]|nr:DegQ family serine endoprotease [Deltaproteobacteria bacterium]MBW2016371.1 DegQ family serine endoprotease [Deltaproteobacteria bacterium]MBW2129729.1 DegQ family serine endoprotease [Deltaproteobacteria bacterium]MBW2304140.1 DegQ family serine endoprotease [Deltaproteobacteria bacterium]
MTDKYRIKGGWKLSAIFILIWIFLAPQSAALASVENDALASVQKTSRAFTAIAKKVMPTVVFIRVEKTVQTGRTYSPFEFNNPFDLFNDDFFQRFFGNRYPQLRQPRQYKQMGLGSGFIISKDGYVLTNHHVVGDADKITVRLKDGREFKARIVGSDPRSDVAIIKIKGGKNLPVLPLGDSDALEVGEWVMAIGNPFGLDHTLTVGVVSAKGRTSVGISDYEDFIQTDAAINPGNSGGPLINMKGEAVGINSAIFSKSGGYMGIGFAIPINMVKAIKKQLIEHGKVLRGYLGVNIQDLTKDLMESFGLSKMRGVLVADVTKGSPADKAGIRRGDVVVEYNGKKVENVGHFRNMVALTPPGTDVKITVIRDGKREVLTAKLGSLDEAEGAHISQSGLMEKLGFTVQDLTEDLARQFGYEAGHGVIISQVAQGSPAQMAGFQPGMLILEVNKKVVKNVKEFMEALGESTKTKKVLFLVQKGQYTHYVILQVE